MIPVNERLPFEEMEVFSGPMSIPSAIGSFHELGTKIAFTEWDQSGTGPKNGSIRRDPLKR
jgi:hypothetical protein